MASFEQNELIEALLNKTFGDESSSHESIKVNPEESIHVESSRDENGNYVAAVQLPDGTIITLGESETIDFGHDPQLDDTFSGGPIDISLVDDEPLSIEEAYRQIARDLARDIMNDTLESETDYSEVGGTTIQEIITKWKEKK